MRLIAHIVVRIRERLVLVDKLIQEMIWNIKNEKLKKNNNNKKGE